MRKLNLLLAFLAFSFFILTGCKKDIGTNKNGPTSLAETTTSAKKPALTTAELKAKLDKLTASLPAGYQQRLLENSSLFLKQHPQYRELVLRALNIVSTPCDANTPLSLWLDQELADWNADVVFWALLTGILDFPAIDAIYFENSSANQSFGINGEYTHRVTKAFKDLKRFWNIQSDGIVLVGMHGSMLLNRDKLIRADMIRFGDDQATAEFWADLILDLLATFPQYRNGNHPIFTFNAFAVESFDFPPVGVVPAKIIMGDGVMDGYEALGYGDVAPQAILAHEYGHHIQLQLDLFDDVVSPEATRRTELMADAFSAYYLSHARGASMQWKRVKQFLQVFFNIGDCAFSSSGHHGTPTQRMAAAEWGYSVANNAQKQGHILTAEAFAALFEAKLPQLVAQ